MHHTEELTAKERFLSKTSLFLEKNKKLLIGLLIFVVLAIVGITIVENFLNSQENEASIQAESVENLLSDWASAEEASKTEIGAQLVIEAETILADYPDSIYAQRALNTRGQYFVQVEDWISAANDFNEAALLVPESYYSASLLFNAAVCFENANEIAKSIETLEMILTDYSTYSFDIPHIYFSLGRLFEGQNDTVKAMEYYDLLRTEYESNDWTTLALNRIILLES